jgi:trigger factor
VKTSLETLEPTKVKLTAEVDAADLKPAIDNAYKTIAGQINIPGFRKGKVPVAIINQRVGFGPVIEQAINDSLPNFYGQAAQAEKLRPLAQPDVEITEIPTSATEGTLKFTATVTVRPTFTIPDVSGLEIVVDKAEVPAEDVNVQLDNLRERFGTLVGTDRPAADGDFVVIDLQAKIGDEIVDSVSGISYQIGSGNMLEGLDEALTGLSAGETTTFHTKLVGGPHAGEEADVTVTATGVKEHELPEADDDFAQMASEFDTIGELKDDIREQLGTQQVAAQAVAARTKLMDHLHSVLEIPVPAEVVEGQVHQHLEQENRLEDDTHRAEVTEQTTQGLREQMLLDTLAEHHGVKVSQPELVDYMMQMSRQYNMEPQEFIELVSRSGQVPALVADVARSKAVALALRQVKVTDTDGNVVDLTPIIGSPESDAEQAEAEAKLFEAARQMNEQAELNNVAGTAGVDSNETLPASPADPASISF